MRLAIATVLLWGLGSTGVVFAQTAAAPPPQPNDYRDGKSWLCRPDLPSDSNACRIDNSATIVDASGTLTREAWKADPNAPVDCFYVYPTVSTDSTPNSDMIADPAEHNVIRQQFARFGSVCRQF